METSAAGSYAPERYDEIAGLEDRHFWFRARNRLFVWALRRHHPSARTMLDVGCGTGHVLEQLHREMPALRLTGSEVFSEGLDHARQRVGGDVGLVRADARCLPFGQEFDVVGAFDVIEHIDDDARVAAELFRVVRPGGLLLMTVPQHRWLWSQADVRARHVRRYTAATLHSLLRGAGFEIVRSTSFVFLLLPPMLLSRVLTRLRGRKGSGDLHSELHLAGWLNTVLDRVLRLELAAIYRGVSFPVGGSRFVVARRPSG